MKTWKTYPCTRSTRFLNELPCIQTCCTMGRRFPKTCVNQSIRFGCSANWANMMRNPTCFEFQNLLHPLFIAFQIDKDCPVWSSYRFIRPIDRILPRIDCHVPSFLQLYQRPHQPRIQRIERLSAATAVVCSIQQNLRIKRWTSTKCGRKGAYTKRSPSMCVTIVAVYNYRHPIFQIKVLSSNQL